MASLTITHQYHLTKGTFISTLLKRLRKLGTPFLIATLIVVNSIALTKLSTTDTLLNQQTETTVKTNQQLIGTSQKLKDEQTANQEISSNLTQTQSKMVELQQENDQLKANKQAKEAAAALAAQQAAAQQAQVTQAAAVGITGDKYSWLADSGISSSDWTYVDYIVSHESGWRYDAYNSSDSGAYGLGQALPASKMAAYGSDYMSNPVTQLKWADAYATQRYGSWYAAYSFWTANHYW